MSTVAEHLEHLRKIAEPYGEMHGLRQNDPRFQFHATLLCAQHLDELEKLAATDPTGGGYTDEEVAALNADQYRNNLSCVDVVLPGDRRRRVYFNEAGEAREVWLIPRGGKQTERDVRPGTNDWNNSVEAAKAVLAARGVKESGHQTQSQNPPMSDSPSSTKSEAK